MEPMQVKKAARLATDINDNIRFPKLNELYKALPDSIPDYGKNSVTLLHLDEESGSQFLIDPDTTNRSNLECLLGKGGFAKVYRLKYKGEDHAVKVIQKKRVNGKVASQAKIQREVDIHRQMNHINIVRFIKYFEDSESMYMLLEYGGPVSLSQVLKKRGRLQEPEVKYYLKQIVSGVRYIHNLEILHRDLKLSNFFISEKMLLKIGDFGLSTFICNVDESRETVCGTPNYISPEVVRKVGHSYPADIWAIGCVIYALVCGKPPFETSKLKDTYRLITKAQYPTPSGVTTATCKIIKKCLQKEPQDRISLMEMDESSYLIPGTFPNTLPQSALYEKPDVKRYIEPPSERLPCGCTFSYSCSNLIHLLTYDEEIIIEAQGGSDILNLENKEDKDLHEFLTVLQKHIQRTTARGVRRENPVEVTERFSYVTKWVDYSHKYGMCFQLSNDYVGARYNEGIFLSVGDNRQLAHIHDGGKTYHIDMTDPPTEKNKIITVAEYFITYMDKSLIKGGNIKEDRISGLIRGDNFKMRRWVRSTNTMAMIVSPGLYQINFLKDHTKIILSYTDTHAIQLMYIDEKRETHTYHLSDISAYGCTAEILDRMKFAQFHLTNHLFKRISLQ